MKHKHHIVPRHMGGSDDPSNLIELTVEEHAEAHRKLYEEHGRWQDKVAWQGLTGLIGHDEIMQEMWNARKGAGNTFYGKKHTEETKRKIGEKTKIANTGKVRTAEQRQRMSENHHRYWLGKVAHNKGVKQGPQSAEQLAKKSHPVMFEGVEYPSIHEAHRQTGLSRYYIKKLSTGK